MIYDDRSVCIDYTASSGGQFAHGIVTVDFNTDSKPDLALITDIRSQAQYGLFSLLNYFPYSYEILLDRLIDLLNKSDELDHDQIKGCLYILSGNTQFFLPTKSSWILIEKLWPTVTMIHLGNKLTTQNLMNNLHKKIINQFLLSTLVENVNETARIAAETLWNPIDKCEKDHEENIRSYYNLMETLHSLIKRDTLTSKQQKIIISFLYRLLQKDVPIPSTCIQTFMNVLIHDNLEIRKYAEQGLLTVCHLQKTVRYFIEKSSSSSTELEWEQICFFDKIHHEYYTWPKTMKCSLNKRIQFIEKYLQFSIFEEPKFNQTRFDLFKVNNWTIEMLDEFWKKSTPFLTEVCINLNTETCYLWRHSFRECMKNIDQRRMSRLIDFLRTFRFNQKLTKIFDETTRWNLIYTLNIFQWKIPSIWKEINQEVKELTHVALFSVKPAVTAG